MKHQVLSERMHFNPLYSGHPLTGSLPMLIYLVHTTNYKTHDLTAPPEGAVRLGFLMFAILLSKSEEILIEFAKF